MMNKGERNGRRKNAFVLRLLANLLGSFYHSFLYTSFTASCEVYTLKRREKRGNDVSKETSDEDI